MSTLVFVYGSLKRGLWNNRVLGNSRLLGTGITVSDSYHMFDGTFPYVVTGGLSKIAGEVYEVTEEGVLESLDRLEGVPNHYVRSYVDVKAEIDGEENVVHCIMYVASASTAGYILRSPTKFCMTPNDDNVLAWGETE